jgi:hypothetical protein
MDASFITSKFLDSVEKLQRCMLPGGAGQRESKQALERLRDELRSFGGGGGKERGKKNFASQISSVYAAATKTALLLPG